MLKIVAYTIVALVLSGVLWIVYLEHIGPTVVGPRRDVEAICSQIEAGMSKREIGQVRTVEIIKQNNDTDLNDMVFISANRLQVEIQVQGGFSCICQVDMIDGISTGEGLTFCVD